jgi:hypothetical protein
MEPLAHTLRTDFPKVIFVAGDKFYWSPKENTVFYDARKKNKPAQWALLHELCHAVLGHTSYKTDFELLQLEVAAWHKAKEFAPTYDMNISEDHIQDCLDTYRDWLHARSKCPVCGEHGLQDTSSTYECINCRATWHVSGQRFCRPYRKTKTT